MELSNKTAVITGGASGMGATTAEYLAAHGVQVVLLDQHLEKALAHAKTIGGFAFACDVSDAHAVDTAFEEITRTVGDVHILVNCAGIAPAARVVGRTGAMPLQDFQRVIDINLVGTFNVLRVAASKMILQEPVNADGERGVIINTASVAAFEGQIGQAAYSAAKGGVASMTLPIARELSQFGVRVMAIAPGIIETPMMQAMPENVQASLADAVPFPKRLGQALEYARLAAHIVENAYLNGDVIRLDGAIRLAPK